MDNSEQIAEVKEQLRIAREEIDKLKRHFNRLDELYGDCENLVVLLEKKLNELYESTPKSKLRKLEEENQNLKDRLAELQTNEKEFGKEIRREVKDSNVDSLDLMFDV